MIINHTGKYIFIAIPKTASTTVHMAWGHTIHPPPPEYHMRLYECLEQNRQCLDYFKFCFVRNPYERFASTWFNLIDPRAGHVWATDLLKFKDMEDFCDNFLDSEFCEWVHFRKQIEYVMVNEKVGMDFIGRQENFYQDFNKACEMIGVSMPSTGHFRPSRRPPLNEVMTEKMKEIIYTFYKSDFDQFNYEK